MIDNEYVQKAEDELEYINANEEERMRAKFRERSEWNYNFDMESMYEHGVKEGLEQGSKEQSIKIAKKMLEEKLDIDVIIKTTGLTKEEIQKLQD